MVKNWKKIAVSVVVLSLMGSSLLFADSITQKVRVWSNGKEISDGGYLINGVTYIPAREAGGAVSWDNSGRVTILKPNVHITLIDTKDESMFGNVKLGRLKFKVLAQIDSLAQDIAAIRVIVTDPSGSVREIDSTDASSQKDNFWFTTKETTYEFKAAGKYKVGVQIKLDKNADYTLVSEKVINTIQ